MSVGSDSAILYGETLILSNQAENYILLCKLSQMGDFSVDSIDHTGSALVL